MTSAELHERLKSAFGDEVGELAEAKVDPFVTVKAERLVDVCRWLKSTAEVQLDHCNDITAVDQPKRNVIELVYHLDSYTHRHTLVLKVEADRANPSVPSVQDVWKAANWLEREIYDLMGVEFRGHPDLRRILLPDDWVGHPLRKDYQEAGGYHGVSNVRPDPLAALEKQDQARRAAAPAAAAAGAAPAAQSAPTAAPAAAAPAAAAPAAPAATPATTTAAPATTAPAPAPADSAQTAPASDNAPASAAAGGEKA